MLSQSAMNSDRLGVVSTQHFHRLSIFHIKKHVFKSVNEQPCISVGVAHSDDGFALKSRCLEILA